MKDNLMKPRHSTVGVPFKEKEKGNEQKGGT